MPEFQNTIDLLGDENVCRAIIERTIVEFNDNVVNKIRESAFYGCLSLVSVNLPNITTVGSSAFYQCIALTKVDMASLTKIDAGQVFRYCRALTTLILRSQTLCSLASTTSLNGTPFASGGKGGTVYCPASLITQYQQATNWSTLYAAGTCNFVAIEGSEYE